MNTQIACLEFESLLVKEYSALPITIPLGKHKCRMELHRNHENYSWIIWNYGKKAADEDETVIGLEIEGNKVVGYDGVFSLPKQAELLLRAAGYDVTDVTENPETEFQWNSAHPVGTCAKCGSEMAHNVPRLGDGGGFIHKAAGKYECKNEPQ